jgi:hypothetical protein
MVQRTARCNQKKVEKSQIFLRFLEYKMIQSLVQRSNSFVRNTTRVGIHKRYLHLTGTRSFLFRSFEDVEDNKNVVKSENQSLESR